ncbi:MAG: AMP-binding protein [Candidatus Lokiarchaeota archaeon]|nr:AMP-binding protein [Candidatus Lokiarchaeota archaeon]
MSIEEFNKIPHLLVDYVEKWAKERPDDIAIIDADDGKWITWNDFKNMMDLIALEFINMDLQKGDVIVTMLPLLPEHIFISYACFKLGILFCPLDVRLKERETVRCVKLLKNARRLVYIHPDDTDSEDKWGRKKFYAFKQFARKIREEVPEVTDFIQFGPQEDADEGTIGILNFIKKARANYKRYYSDPQVFNQKMEELEKIKNSIDPANDCAMIIYTTGSTGFPKPAMLSNAGIICQNMCMAKGFEINKKDRMLVNLPPSHVGCQTEQLMTTIFIGGISVILHAFKAEKSLLAIEKYKVTAFGQIPSLFVMEWRLKKKYGALKDYKDYDLSSLRFALYGGQAVSRKFLKKLSEMARYFGSGLGLTEMSGFVSYTPFGDDVTPDDILAGLGHDYPITPLSIREKMKENGMAGDEKPDGEIGEVCYSGPQVFLGYYDNEDATKKTISTEGICYTGDLGFKDDEGLHLVGRGKFVIKPKGYQVYPPEVEEHIAKLPEVSLAAVVGAKHEVYSEGVVAFVELNRGKQITKKKLKEHCRQLAGYKRPSLFVFLDQIPLNRVDKTDYHDLNKIVGKYIEEERAAGRWDAEK